MGLAVHKYDAVVIGAGGAGMRCSLQLARAGLRVAEIGRASCRERVLMPV